MCVCVSMFGTQIQSLYSLVIFISGLENSRYTEGKTGSICDDGEFFPETNFHLHNDTG